MPERGPEAACGTAEIKPRRQRQSLFAASREECLRHGRKVPGLAEGNPIVVIGKQLIHPEIDFRRFVQIGEKVGVLPRVFCVYRRPEDTMDTRYKVSRFGVEREEHPTEKELSAPRR
ncbi:MAG: hypothetical protein EA384_00050 [Spirochaetaceae bacterium]|nr:MAG: hypothetical protein EA384_00050 [Spirochaetaceae bacterium]